MRRALGRARIVAASVPSIATHLGERYNLPRVRILPLGVNLRLFAPAAEPREGFIFHLGSADPRDRTMSVVLAYERLLRLRPTAPPPLVIGGNLGSVGR